MSIQKQAKQLKKKGILIGTRTRKGQKIHIYMLRDLFAEVVFKDGHVEEQPESVVILRGLTNLNEYLEEEFKTSGY